MIKKLLGLLTLGIPWLLQAQVTVSVQLPPAGLVQKDQLWNIVLVNNSNTAMEATILLNLQDAVTGQSVLSAGTRSIMLNKGVRLLNAQDVQPVQYNYGAAPLSNQYLPLGSYLACYTITRLVGDKAEALAEECVRVTIGPLSPPLLNAPADGTILQNGTPQLSWIPPAPLDMFQDLSYDLNIVEVIEGQAPSEAILYNTPLYTKSFIKAPYEHYPSSYARLQEGRTYAWQVTARNGLNYAVPTEVWTFRIAKDSVAASPVSATYILLKNIGESSGVHYVSGSSLLVKYYSFDKEHVALVRFLDKDGKTLQEVRQKVIYGDNFFNFSLNSRFHSGEIYRMELIDLQNHKHTATFSIK